jgi:mannose-6-phosphate isomerase-like protein (cupin superfamily)
MLIDFNKIEETITPHMRGGEKNFAAHIFTDGKNKIMLCKLEPGASIGYHKHETNSETIYVLSGQGKMLVEDGEEHLGAGSCHYCPKGGSHSFINDGQEDLHFFAVVPEQV